MLYSLLFELNSLPFKYKLIIFLTYTVSVIIALTFHEFAHAFSACKLGDKTAKNQGRLTLNPMAHFDTSGLVCFLFFGFGWAKPVPINAFNFKKVKRDTFIVSISGVLTNLIFAFIFCPLALLTLNIAMESTFGYIIYCLCTYIYQTNLVLMVFNLLPIYPLDGFNAIASQLSYANRFVNFMQKYGSIILLATLIVFNYTNIFSELVYYISYPINKFWGLILF